MKKIVAILMTVLLMAGLLCATAFTASAEDRVVIRVCGMKEDGTLILPETYTSFKDGWNQAAKLAQNHDWMDDNGIVRIVVDLYDDWKADGGKFGSGTGFENNAIRVPGNTRIMINMNGHSIDRGRTSYAHNGEVIFIGKKADLIINGGQNLDQIITAGMEPGTVKMGTIKGGYSCNGAGGIHMDGNGKLTLNNVHISGNRTKDDDGGGIAAYNSSVVIMNGGSISNNIVFTNWHECFGGGLYLRFSSATLNGVLIKGNEGEYGAAIFADRSTVTLNHCIVEGNGLETEQETIDVIHITGDEFRVVGGEIKNNGKLFSTAGDWSRETHTLINLNHSPLTIIGTEQSPVKITNNHVSSIIRSDYDTSNSPRSIEYCEITDNDGMIMTVRDYLGSTQGESTYRFANCRFNNNNLADIFEYDFYAYSDARLVLTDCDMGDSTFTGDEYITFIDASEAKNPAGSIFGEGSLTGVLVIISLVCSLTSICLTLVLYKRRSAPATAEDSDEE